MIAHVGGVPLEETLLPWLTGVGGVGAGLLLTRAWFVSRVRRARRPRPDRSRSSRANG